MIRYTFVIWDSLGLYVVDSLGLHVAFGGFNTSIICFPALLIVLPNQSWWFANTPIWLSLEISCSLSVGGGPRTLETTQK